MKLFLKKIIAFLNKIILYFGSTAVDLKGNYFYFFLINASVGSNVLFKKSSFIHTDIRVLGNRNVVCIDSANVADSLINIEGDNNQITLDQGVNLRGATIILRGNSCRIQIGKNSTFGGVRIVNAGSDCSISIGEGCMFSDHVEIWASDTHPIYNKNNEIINTEKPITIGNKVWVGSRAIILKGVNIGNGSVIGMGSVVTRDVPHNAVSVGNPNRIIKDGIKWSLHPT